MAAIGRALIYYFELNQIITNTRSIDVPFFRNRTFISHFYSTHCRDFRNVSLYNKDLPIDHGTTGANKKKDADYFGEGKSNLNFLNIHPGLFEVHRR